MLLQGENLLESSAGGDVVPPSAHMGAGGEELALASGVHKHVSVRQVRQIRQREEVPGQVLAGGEMRLVNVQDLLELGNLLSNHLVVALQAEQCGEDDLEDDRGTSRVEVLGLHFPPLVHKSALLRVLSKQRCALSLVLLSKVSDY